MDAVRKALQSLPSGLDLTYSRMLQSIDASVQSQVIASLKWLACSMYPLRIGLLAQIFVLPSTPDDGFEKSSPLFSPMDVLKYFPGLIVLEEARFQDPRTKSKEDLFVRLAHFSIKEYLTSDRISQSRASSFAFYDSEAHMHIGRWCLAYHLQINSMTGISDLYQHDNKYAKRLIEYASLYWAEHLEKIPYTSWPIEISQNAILSLSIGSQSLLTMVTDYLKYLSPFNVAVYKYQKAMQIHKDLIQRPHCYTAMRGIRQLTERLISRGFGVNKYLTQGDLDEGLRYATKNRRKSVAKLFLDNGAQIHDCLKKAAEQGDAAIVGLLLDHGSETNPLATKLESALQAALWNGHIDVLKLLLSRGADVNSPFRRAQRVSNSKHYSIGRQPYIADCLHFLFDSGAGVNMDADCSLTAALYVAICNRYTKVARQLLDRGAEVNELAGQDGYPLQAAVARMRPDIEFIRYLLDLGADSNSQGGSTNTALQAAYSSAPLLSDERKKLAEAIELLLNKGADVTIKGGKYGTALQAACGNDSIAISNIQMLLQKGADVNDQGGEYSTALQAACMCLSRLDQGRKLGLVQLLLSHGADVRAEGGYYGTALQAACARQLEHEPVANEDIVRLLISAGADVNTQGGRYGTALQAACENGNTEVVRLLLKEGAFVNAEGGYYGTALQAACTKGHIQVARLLLDHGANIHLRNNGAWHAAVLSRNDDLVGLLLDLGVEVNDPHGPHGTALHTVLRLEWPTDPVYSFIDQNGDGISESELDGLLLWKRIIRFLVNRGADPNLVAGEYGTALQAASAVKPRFPKSIKNEYPGAVGSEFLLELCPSVDINAQGGLFGSALQAAAYSGQTPTVSLLLNKGAHANTRSGKYGSALNAAVIAGNWDIVQILLEADAVPDCHMLLEPDEEWLQSVLEDEDDGQGAVERYRKFWEVEMASQVDKKKEKAQTSI
jgi:ankyrin repeat protein